LSPEARSLIASTQAVGEDEEGAASASVSVPPLHEAMTPSNAPTLSSSAPTTSKRLHPVQDWNVNKLVVIGIVCINVQSGEGGISPPSSPGRQWSKSNGVKESPESSESWAEAWRSKVGKGRKTENFI